MAESQTFENQQPTCEALMGVVVEVNDQGLEMVGSGVTGLPTGCAAGDLPRREDLFGLTLSVDDGLAREESPPAPPTIETR